MTLSKLKNNIWKRGKRPKGLCWCLLCVEKAQLQLNLKLIEGAPLSNRLAGMGRSGVGDAAIQEATGCFIYLPVRSSIQS